MEKIIDYLKQLDLSEIEANLYLTLLQTGPISVRDVANAIGIKRTTAYLYVEQLEAKGLVIKMVQGSRPQIAASPAENALEQLVKNSIQKTKTIEKGLPEMLQKIQMVLPTQRELGEAEIKYYKGENGIKRIYDEALKTKELRAYANFVSGVIFPEIEKMYFEAFKKNPDLTMYELLADSPSARKQPQFDNKRYFRKYIPPNVKLSTADNLIFDGKVCIINLENKISGTILQNKDYYKNSKEIFDFIWNLIPETK